MTYRCIVPKCDVPTSGRSNKCNAHRLALKRHGHPLQTGLKVTEYEPYRIAIQRQWKANEASPFWKALHTRWDRLQDQARTILGEHSRGVATSRYEVKAADELLKLGRNVPFITLACTALALYALEADRPRRFEDDRAFRSQLVRKVRGLDDLAIYKSWNHQRKAERRVYRDMPPRAVLILAEYLLAAFGEASVLLRSHAEAQARREGDESRQMADAVRSLR